MPFTVKDILDIIELIAPTELAESWDNVGLMIGSPSAPANTLLIGLDPTLSLLKEAEALGADVIITHHPFIFHPLKTLQLEQPDGQFIEQALRNKTSIISCHTNFDTTAEGVSDALADSMGLVDTEPLVSHDGAESATGLGRIGNFSSALSPADFLLKLKAACAPPWLLGAGVPPVQVKRAAICGGSCSDLAETAFRKGAQVFVTSEVKHSIARWAEQAGLWLIDAGHFATENPAMKKLAERLTSELQKRSEQIKVVVTTEQRSPLQLI